MSGILNSIYNSSVYALYLHSKALTALQEQYSTGSRINRASDDPSSAYKVMGLNTQTTQLKNYIAAIDDVSGVLEMSSTIIGSMTTELANVKVSLSQIISGTYDESGRKRLAGQVDDALEQMVSLANTKHSGNYIYGGSNTSTAPYTVERTDDMITKVTYQGSDQQRDVAVAQGVESSAYYVGDDMFRSDERTTPTFTGDTGVTGGSGTSSIRGNVWLNVTQDGDGDYNLSLGGTTVDLGSYTGDLSNVPVKDADGNVLYVNATNLSNTGYEMVSVSGTYDIFNILINVRDLLLNEKNLSTTQLQQCRSELADSLDEVSNLLLSQETSIGSKIGFVDNLRDSLENMQYNTEDESTAIEQADIAQVAIDLARRETLYQMTLSATGKLMSMSLLDFID
ncbi:MAG: flagellar hook-associated protein FlgL [Planctomycetaceae bacterium]|nr:flagellar hook-associated protein FlgL [Planctomycetaceae bacterium]